MGDTMDHIVLMVPGFGGSDEGPWQSTSYKNLTNSLDRINGAGNE